MRPLSLVLSGLLLVSSVSFADDLDDAMEGFDEPATETALDEDALSGFDDEPSSGLDEDALDGFDDEESVDLSAIDEESGNDWYAFNGYLSFLVPEQNSTLLWRCDIQRTGSHV